MDNMFAIEEINNAIKNQHVIVKKKLFTNTPTWEEFINHLDSQFNSEDEVFYDGSDHLECDSKMINTINVRENFYLITGNAEDDYFPGKIDPVASKLQSVLPSQHEYFGSFALVNFVGGEKPIQIHSDPRHSFYWQACGSSLWQIWNSPPPNPDDKNPDQTEMLEPGDIIFVPHGVWHNVRNDNPRAAISLTYTMTDKDCMVSGYCRSHQGDL